MEAIEISTAKLADLLREGKIPEKDRRFAKDLIKDACTPRGLTKNQMYWVGRLIQQTLAPPPAKVIGDFSGVYDLFQRASGHLKFPKIILRLPDGTPIKLYVAGPRSRLPGVVNVVDGRTWEEVTQANRDNKIWYGRVDKDGQWTPGRDAPREHFAPIIALLKRLAENPEEVAAEYGKLSGNCCFCNRPLEDARSTAVGYGPQCADRYGLQWGRK